MLSKKGFEVGRDIESMASDMGRWMGAVSDIKKVEEYNKKPPLFKKLFAHNLLSRKRWKSSWQKEDDDMREQLRQIITYTEEIVCMARTLKNEADIRKKRQAMIYAEGKTTVFH